MRSGCFLAAAAGAALLQTAAGSQTEYEMTIPEFVTSWNSGADFGGAHSKNWTFLERFAFGTEARWEFTMRLEGMARYSSNDTSGSEYAPLGGTVNGVFKGFHLIAYYDDQWDSMYPTNPRTCTEMVDPNFAVNQFAVPSSIDTGSDRMFQKLRCFSTHTVKAPDASAGGSGAPSAVQTPPQDGDLVRVGYECTGEREFGAVKAHGQSLDDKYWFFVLACCDCQPVRIKLEMHLTNGEDNWIKEFSTDESWVYSCVVGAICWSIAVLFGQFYSDKEFNKKGNSHLTRRLFKAAVVLNIISLLCYLSYYRKYSSEGAASDGGIYAGDVVWLFAEITFISLLFVLAKGWTIYRPELRKPSVIKMAAFLLIYLIVFLCVIVNERNNYKKEEIKFRYDSDPGYVMVALYFVSWGWFSWYIYVTIKPFKDNKMLERITLERNRVCPEEKHLFFKVFWAVFTVWFLMFPFAVIGLINNSADFRRTNSAWCVWVIRQGLGYTVMLLLWWPSHHNFLFPFERSATTIGLAPIKRNESEEDPYQDVRGVDYEVDFEKAQNRRGIFNASPDGFADQSRRQQGGTPADADADRRSDDEYVDHHDHVSPTKPLARKSKLPPIGHEEDVEASRV